VLLPLLLNNLLVGGSSGAGDAHPTGVSATAALGAPTETADANLTGTGVSATAALGAPTETADANLTGTGVSATAALGTATAIGGSPAGDAHPTGVSATAALGAPTETADANLTGTGVSATAALGAPTETADANLTGTGVSATAALGAPTETADANLTGTGVSAPPVCSTNFGTAWADGGRRPKTQLKRIKEGEAYPNAVVVRTHVGAPHAVGVVTAPYVSPWRPAVATPFGVETIASSGSVEISAGASVKHTGFALSASIGVTLASAGAVAAPVGIYATSQVEECEVSVDVWATPGFDEGCESYTGNVFAVGIQNPTESEMMYAAQMLLNYAASNPRSPHVRH
jgi:hypothetical protein